MTVKELIERLSQHPDDSVVWFDSDDGMTDMVESIDGADGEVTITIT